jgi:dTDP-4-dehydrorhamnose 3,5-epimerase-like enzyme
VTIRRCPVAGIVQDVAQANCSVSRRGVIRGIQPPPR